jgi:hypothetical protein
MEKIEKQNKEKDEEIKKKNEEIKKKNEEIKRKNEEIKRKNEEIKRKDEEIRKITNEKERENKEKDEEITVLLLSNICGIKSVEDKNSIINCGIFDIFHKKLLEIFTTSTTKDDLIKLLLNFSYYWWNR